MFKFITFIMCIVYCSAGIIPEHHGLHTYSLPSIHHDTLLDHHHHHHPAAIALPAPTIIKYAPAPTIVKIAEPIAPIVKIAEPIVLKSYAPLAESYSNLHKVSYKIPIAHHHHHPHHTIIPTLHSSSIALPYSSHGLYGDHHIYGHSYGHHHGLLH